MNYFFTLLLPLLWVPVSVISYFHPGDEYGLYAFSNIVGTWIFFIIQPDVHSLMFPGIAAAVGGMVMAAAGLGMDRLRVNRPGWMVAWVVLSALLLVQTVYSYPTIERALAKNGSWTAYIAGAMNTAMYLSIIIAVVFKAIVLIVKRVKHRST